GVTSLIGIKKEEPKGAQTAAEVAFAAGAAESSDLSAQIEALLKKLRQSSTQEVTLRHELGSDDLARCARRANPDPQEAAALAARLRDRKLALQQTRQEVVGRARAVLASSND